MKNSLLAVTWAACLFTVTGHAAVDPDSPLLHGPYAGLMYSQVEPDNNRGLDTGTGGTLVLGYRLSEDFALELYGVYGQLDPLSAGSESSTMSGGGIGAMAYFANLLPGAYLPFAVGFLKTDLQGPNGETYDGLSFEAGVGYLFPFDIGRYDFGVRAEARYRHHNGQDGRDLDEKRSGQDDALFNLGLQLPFGLRPPEPVPEPAPVQVVEPVVPPDSDGDSVIDPLDQCPATLAGEQVDEQGCSLPPPCKTPEPGEHLSLAGCGSGDVLVLRGVSFDFDRAALTPNAERILDGVAAELAAHPQIRVEIGGHTDALGSDTYNQALSQARAQSVRDYLASAGIAVDRMLVAGYGETQPVADNETDEGRELNRRVELRIIGGDGA